jgi:purine-nucleoside phosphorylase
LSETDLLSRLNEAVEVIRAPGEEAPSVGLVLGSGLGGFGDGLSGRIGIPYREIPRFPVPTGVVGHKGELLLGSCGRTPVVVLSGRLHYYEGWTLDDVVFPVRVLARMGVKAVVLTNAAGGIRRTLRPGDLMLISDHINAFGGNPLIGGNEDALGPRFPNMSEVYDPALRRVALAEARRLRIALREGVYVGLHGPSYETPAEIRALARIGADAVGMSTVPEAIALRHAGVRVLGISMITNMAAGVLKKPPGHSAVLETTRRAEKRFVRLLSSLVPKIAAEVAR